MHVIEWSELNASGRSLPYITGSHAHTIHSSGSHNHVVSGGDSETRPINAAVEWIIFVGRVVEVQ